MKHIYRLLCLIIALALCLSGCAKPAPETVPETTEVQTEPPATAPTEPVFDAYQMAKEMTLEEKAGQIFLACCSPSTAQADVSAYHLGGYILFGNSFENKSATDIINDIASYQANASVPLLICVDEEGGTVCRVSSNSQLRSSRFLSPRKLYAQGGMELIITTEVEKCQLLRSLGINSNAAPVCDITNDSKAFMYSRSLGEGPEITGQFVTNVLNVMEQNGIGGILKHFPGYGNNTDTHTGIAVDNRSIESLESVDLVPFQAGIDEDCGAIMVSHTFINAMDSQYPASLSTTVHRYLREDMGFDGVIVTDDLSMDAITDLYGEEEAAILAVLAGNDLLCTWDYHRQHGAIISAVQSGRIPEETLDRAAARVLQWKYDMGLIPWPPA